LPEAAEAGADRVADFTVTGRRGGGALQLQQQSGAVGKHLVVLAAHRGQRVDPGRTARRGQHRQRHPPERGVHTLQEQLLLRAEQPEHIGLRDARATGDRLGRGAGQPGARELVLGKGEDLLAPLLPTHPCRRHGSEVSR
jgi:hypothetical protein